MSPIHSFKPYEPFFAESLVQSSILTQNTYVPTYFERLDKVVKGFHNSNLTIIGGRPCVGCRMLVLTMACKQAWKNHKVACFFMSLSELELTDRVRRIYDAYEKPHTLSHPFFYLDYLLDIDKFRNEVKRLKREENIEIVYVESVQMIGVKDCVDSVTKAEIAVKTFWEMSRELDTPIVALSSLSRGPEIRGGERRPLLCDLRTTSTLEMYADKVLLLYRPAYYGFMCDEMGNPTIDVVEANVVKNSNGAIESGINLKFDHTLSVFVDEVQLLNITPKMATPKES